MVSCSLVYIGSGYGLSPIWCQAITLTSADLFSVGSSKTAFSGIWIKIQNHSCFFEKKWCLQNGGHFVEVSMCTINNLLWLIYLCWLSNCHWLPVILSGFQQIKCLLSHKNILYDWSSFSPNANRLLNFEHEKTVLNIDGKVQDCSICVAAMEIPKLHSAKIDIISHMVPVQVLLCNNISMA